MKHSKENITNIFHTPILNVLNIMDPTGTIKKVNFYTRNCSEDLKNKPKVNIHRNTNLTTEYM